MAEEAKNNGGESAVVPAQSHDNVGAAVGTAVISHDVVQNPGLPPHRKRVPDLDPKSDKRAERTVYTPVSYTHLDVYKRQMQIITSAISSIVLLLGGLSLVNIQLVAMRQRIREIGVRRSFGASGGRIFASVMMESVVATAVAGVLGIALAVAVVRLSLIHI